MEKITKKFLSKALGISRPTLDLYLEKGFPKKIKQQVGAVEDVDYQILQLENQIKLYEYKINKCKEEIEKMKMINNSDTE